MRNIVLIGFMGSGKTTVGIRLSYRMRMPFLDTDKEIERRQGRWIKDIFAADGEEGFRRLETDCLRQLAERCRGHIVSTGGGLPMREENRVLLKKLGTVLYLKAEPETIYGRLKGDENRPLLQGANPEEKIRRLMAEREAGYQAAADVVLRVDGKGFHAIIKEIREAVR